MRGLLDRVAEGGTARPEDPVAAVVEHLRVLLNTRRGGSPAAADFGVTDLSDLIHEFPAGAQSLQRTIRDTILKYEPRMTNVTVRQLPGEHALVLRYEISGQLMDKRARKSIRLNTQISAGGRVEVW